MPNTRLMLIKGSPNIQRRLYGYGLLAKGKFSNQHPKSDRNIWPCKIFKKINDNAYEVDLQDHLGIDSTFTVSDPYHYHGRGDEGKIASVLHKQTVQRL